MLSIIQHRPLSAGRFLLVSAGFAGLYGSITRVAESILVAALMLTVGYLLAIYLYYLATTLAGSGRLNILVLGAAIALVITFALETSTTVTTSLLEMGRLFIVAALAGMVITRTDQPLFGFMAGLIVIMLLTLIQYGPYWSEIMESMTSMGTEMLGWMKTSLKASGMGESSVEDTLANMKATTDMTARLIPTALILFAALQFAIGYLGYCHRLVSRGECSARVIDFTLWKMPYQMAVLVILAAAVRLLAGEPLLLIADNAIAILAFFYSVTGLALVEHGLRGLKMPIWFRIMFYLFLPLTGLLGLVIVAILGFIDSFIDWRKVALGDLGLKKK